MTSLNSKLQLAVLNRKKGRNLLEKGFTLVELMIVIVIVGILSAVALPNFLNQTGKAKATEAQTQISAALKAVGAEYYAGPLAQATCDQLQPKDTDGGGSGWVYSNPTCTDEAVTFTATNDSIKDQNGKSAIVTGTLEPDTGIISNKPVLAFS